MEEENKVNQKRTQFALLLILLIAAAGLRSYRLADLPLWLDELYTFQVARSGLRIIVLNSLNDPHPPLGYAIFSLSSGFGLWQSEWGMRWLSVATGVATVLLVFHLGRQKLDNWSAFAAALLFAFSPFHIFYSQEARSTALVTFVAAVSIYLVTEITNDPEDRRLWVWFGIVTLVGLYSSYSYALVIAPQALYLALVLRQWRKSIGLGLLLLLCGIPFFYFFFQSVPDIARQHAAIQTPLFSVIQGLFGGEPVRYGYFWGHGVITAVFILLFLSAFVRKQSIDPLFIYHVMQFLLPLALFWGVLIPFFNMSMLPAEIKQFTVILPSIFILIGFGFRAWRDRLPAKLSLGLIGAVCLIVIIAGLFSLNRYWQQGKSPEGAAAVAVKAQSVPHDAIVSLHYSLNAAAGFYLSDNPIYTHPRRQDDAFDFTSSVNVVRAAALPRQSISQSTILQQARIWLLLDSRAESEAANMLLERCQVRSEEIFTPFVIHLLEDCS